MSSKKRGLSLEEKRTRMLEVFHNKKEVFQLKDLEKIGPQEKGVVAQSVKDVVKALVDDGLVDNERIGTSVYFWAFPSKAVQSRKRKLTELGSSEAEIRAKCAEINEETKKSKLTRAVSDERESMLKEIGRLKSEQSKLKALLEQHLDNDPDVIAQEKEDIQTFMAAANRWTDNIFSFKSWAKRYGMVEAEINKAFEIPEDFEYLED